MYIYMYIYIYTRVYMWIFGIHDLDIRRYTGHIEPYMIYGDIRGSSPVHPVYLRISPFTTTW